MEDRQSLLSDFRHASLSSLPGVSLAASSALPDKNHPRKSLSAAHCNSASGKRKRKNGPAGGTVRKKRKTTNHTHRREKTPPELFSATLAFCLRTVFRKAHIKKTWFPPFLPRELWRFSLFSEKCGCGVCFAFTFALRFTTSPVIAQICVRFFICVRRAMPPSPEERARSVRVFRCVRLKTNAYHTVSPHFSSRRKRSFYSYLTRDRNSKFQTPNSKL